jgi:hypothetical protein
MLFYKSLLFALSLALPISLFSQTTDSSSSHLQDKFQHKATIHLEKLALTSNNAFEMLEKIPEIIIGKGGGVSLNAAQSGAYIYLNGRQQAEINVYDLLRSLPAHAISKIDVITVPTSNIDATSSAGIVNIELKPQFSNTKEYIASISSVRNIDNELQTSASFFSSTRKSSFLLMGTLSDRGKLSTSRESQSENPYANSSSRTEGNTITQNNGLYYSFQHSLKNHWRILYDGRYLENSYGYFQKHISESYRNSGSLLSQTASYYDNTFTNRLFSQGFNLSKKFISTSSLNIDISADFPSISRYNISGMQPIESQKSGSFSDNSKNYNALFDYSHAINQTFKVGVGLKSNFHQYNSSYNIYNYALKREHYDIIKGHTLINSLYILPTYTSEKLQIKAGLRWDNANVNANNENASAKNELNGVYPYADVHFSLFKSKKNALGIGTTYRKASFRPSYKEFLPAGFYDNLEYITYGSPDALSRITKNVELRLTLNQKPILVAGKYFSNNMRLNYVDGISKPNIGYLLNNVSERDSYVKIMAPASFKGNYNASFTAQYNYYTSSYTIPSPTESPYSPSKTEINIWSIKIAQQYAFSETSRISLNSFYQKWDDYVFSNFGLIDLSYSQGFSKNRLLLLINFAKPLYARKNTLDFSQPEYTSLLTNYQHYPIRFGITLRYNFTRKII